MTCSRYATIIPHAAKKKKKTLNENLYMARITKLLIFTACTHLSMYLWAVCEALTNLKIIDKAKIFTHWNFKRAN